MPPTFRPVWPLVLLVLMCAWIPVQGQTRATGGDIGGTVLDQTGGVLPGATVTATSLETNLSRTAVVEPNGRFLLPALPPGLYSVRAELAGFAPQLLKDLRVVLGGLLDLEITLQIAATQEQITVIGEAGSAAVAKTAVATSVSQTQIDALPIDRRSFTGFTILTPAVTTDRIPQQTQGATPTSGLSFAGQRPRSNNVTVDGLDNNDITVGAVRATFSQDAVREFQVLAASFSAEFGKATGGIVNIVTRSGTNTPAGNLFAFYRDDALSARNYFERFDPSGSPIDPPRAPFSQLQAGMTAGGPVKKDRTFYFGAFERLKVDASNAVTIDDQTVVNHPVTGAPLGTTAALLRGAGFPVETGNVPYAVKFTTFLGRVDHAFNGNHRLAGRFNWAKSLDENIETFGGITARSRAGALDSRDYNVAASLTSILAPRGLNEFRVQVSNRDQVLRALDPTCNGECDREDEGGPTVEITGVASVGRQRVAPQPRASTRYQFLDTFNYYSGDHQLKAGADFNYVRTPKQRLPLHFGGRYIFAALPAIPGLTPGPLSASQAFALGIPAAYVQGYGNPSGPQTYADLSLFVQDDWRLRSGLTLKAGIRYQHQFWWPEEFVITGYPQPYDVPEDWNDIAPRVALAWTPDAATTVHGGWGLFYDNNVTSVVAIPNMVDGRDGVRTLVLRLPNTIAAWNTPGRRLPEPSTSYPSLQFAIDPGLKTPFAHQFSAGIHRRVWTRLTASASVVVVKGFNQLGTIDYNPIVPALGAGRRPEDIGGVAGTSTSVLQYTSFGETSYRGLTLSLDGRVGPIAQLLASYTLSSAKDNSTDFQSAFIPQDNGRGRNPADPRGLPLGFDPDLEHGVSAQDQRHRLVVSGLAPLPWKLQLSGILTVASGRRYTILAGADLNGDGDGGALPSDRARVVPADPATSLARNTGVLPYQAIFDTRVTRTIELPGRFKLEALVEMFNLFNRTNFTEINAIFGRGAYPVDPLPTFGRFEQAGPPRQIQIGARFSF